MDATKLEQYIKSADEMLAYVTDLFAGCNIISMEYSRLVEVSYVSKVGDPADTSVAVVIADESYGATETIIMPKEVFLGGLGAYNRYMIEHNKQKEQYQISYREMQECKQLILKYPLFAEVTIQAMKDKKE